MKKQRSQMYKVTGRYRIYDSKMTGGFVKQRLNRQQLVEELTILIEDKNTIIDSIKIKPSPCDCLTCHNPDNIPF